MVGIPGINTGVCSGHCGCFPGWGWKKKVEAKIVLGFEGHVEKLDFS